MIIVADLTRLYEVERRLKQSEKLAALGRVVEGIAHEVRNCLTSLGGFSSRLQKDDGNNSAGAQYTQIILDDVARLERMVKDIEDYVRFSKFYKFRFDKTNILPLLERAKERVQAVRPNSPSKSVDFITNVG